MNKQILAAAVSAGLMAPGLAAADIQIFGQIQAETGNLERDPRYGGDASSRTHRRNVNHSSVDYIRSDNVLGSIKGGGSNAFGIKGDEDLGNGLTAYFMFNNGFSTFDGDTFDSRGGGSFGGITARDRYVGLRGDGWHVQFGRVNTLYKTASHRYDPFLGTGLQSRANGAMSGGHNGFFNDVARVGFKSGGLSGGIDIKWEDAANEDTPQSGGDAVGLNTVDKGSWTGAIKYGQKDWEAGLAYIDFSYLDYTPADPTASPPTRATTEEDDLSAWKIHGKYDIGDFSLRAQYERVKVDEMVADQALRGDGRSTLVGLEGGNGAEEYRSLHLSLTYKVSGSTSLMARFADTEWQDNVHRNVSDPMAMGGSLAAINYDVEGRHWAVGVRHDLSKRTHVYGGYMDNDYDYDYKHPIPAANNRYIRKDEITGWAVGMRHKF